MTIERRVIKFSCTSGGNLHKIFISQYPQNPVIWIATIFWYTKERGIITFRHHNEVNLNKETAIEDAKKWIADNVCKTPEYRAEEIDASNGIAEITPD